MKKFGTPIGEAPGWASEKDGFVGAGGVCAAGGGAAAVESVVFFCAFAGLVFLDGFLEASTLGCDLLDFLPVDFLPVVFCAVVFCGVCLPALGALAVDDDFFCFGVAAGLLGEVEDDDEDGADCFCGALDGVVVFGDVVVVGGGVGGVAGTVGVGGGGGVATVGVTCCTTAPRSWTLTTGIATPATVIELGAVPGSPV